MDCTETQYNHNGQCRPCLQCGPGLELSEDCGYGNGQLAYCTPCSFKTYKEDWGYHNCRFCQSCKHLNRHQNSPCTSRINAICGECLPGFYSKTRMDGQQDLECMPCSSVFHTGHQCSRSGGVDVEKVLGPESLNLNYAAANTLSVVVVTMAIILSVVLFVNFRQTILRKFFKGCQVLQRRSQGDIESAASTMNAVTLNPKLEGQDPAVKPLFRMPSSVEEYDLPVSVTMSPLGHPQDCSQMLATQPPAHYTATRNCSSGFVSPMSSEPSSDSQEVTVEPPAPLQDCGASVSVSSLLQLPTTEGHCASEQQENYQHVPVECSELDIHKAASSALDLLHSQTESCCSSRNLEIASTTENLDCSPSNRVGEKLRSLSARLEARTDSCWSSPQQGAFSSSLGDSNGMAETLSLLKKCTKISQGVGLWRLPQVLVESMALKLDPMSPGVANYQQVALKLGVPSQVLTGLSGFEHVFRYLSSSTLLTVPDLFHTFYHLQRLDTLLLLSEYTLQHQSPQQCYITSCTG